jgi:hypothetical protein
MPNLRSSLHDLANSFTNSIRDAIRSASLEELIGKADGGAGTVGNGRRAGRSTVSSKAAPIPALKTPKSASSSGRLPRRSAEDIAVLLEQVVALVKKNREGLRAEQIRETLGLQAKEMPRVLKEGLSARKLKTKGQKRATTYFVA